MFKLSTRKTGTLIAKGTLGEPRVAFVLCCAGVLGAASYSFLAYPVLSNFAPLLSLAQL